MEFGGSKSGKSALTDDDGFMRVGTEVIKFQSEELQ